MGTPQLLLIFLCAVGLGAHAARHGTPGPAKINVWLQILRIAVLHQAKAYEQAAEEQNFRRQEQPHTELAGIELLLHGGEVMLMIGIVLVLSVPVVRMNSKKIQSLGWTCEKSSRAALKASIESMLVDFKAGKMKTK